MGLRGPKPQPTALKIAKGNPGRRVLNEHEPVPPPGQILPPRWLGESARAIWNETAPVAIAMKTLTTADVLAFARYCDAFARYIELRDFVWSKGPTGTTYAKHSGEGKSNRLVYVHELPQAAELRRITEILIKLEDRFGMNPSARSRINVQPAAAPMIPSETAVAARADDGPFNLEEFLKGGGPAPPRPAPAKPSNPA